MEEYLELLQRMPGEQSDDWWIWLTENNEVVYTDKYWVIIENMKYHGPIHTHYTIFPKDYCETWAELSVRERNGLFKILNKYDEWDVYRNRLEMRTLKRFHLHLTPRIDIIPPIRDETTTRTSTTGAPIPVVGFDAA